MSRQKLIRLVGLVSAGAAGVAILRRTALAVASTESAAFDAAVREQVLSLQSAGGDVVSQVVTALSAPALLVIVNCAVAYALRRRGRAIWLPIAAAPFLSMTAGATFSRTLPQQFAPGSADCEPCFPSGHTTGSTAEAATIAYLGIREGFVSGTGGAVLLLGAGLEGVNRLYRDRHWASDIIAGWSAGLAIASICAIASEILSNSPQS
jgi:undecaprenyl-diphosphatase